MALRMIGSFITNARLTRDNLRIKQIDADGRWRIVLINSEGKIIAHRKESFENPDQACELLNKLIEE